MLPLLFLQLKILIYQNDLKLEKLLWNRCKYWNGALFASMSYIVDWFFDEWMNLMNENGSFYNDRICISQRLFMKRH